MPGRNLIVLFAVVIATGVSAYAQTPPPQPSDPLHVAADRAIDIKHVLLDLHVDLAKKTAQGKASIQFRVLRATNEIVLDAVDFEIKKVELGEDGGQAKAGSFRHDGKQVAIELPGTWSRDKAGTVIIHYLVHDPAAGLHFFGPTAVEPNVPLQVWSQGEPETNRFWFPCFDHPDQRQSTELIVTVPEGYEAISNGKLTERTEDTGAKTVTWHWRQDLPQATYLVTLVVGKFDVVREEWEGIPIVYYVPPGRKADVPRTFGRTRDMLSFFSNRFGIHYPWAKYAQVAVEQFNYGGMENTSATTLTDRAIHDERAALDDTADSLIAHEMGHQWWGDLLTCRDWAHTWLNEGFATYAEACWVEHHDGADEFAYNMLLKAKAAMAGDHDRPIVDRRYPFINAMFDARSYPKGAWVLHMLRRQLGDDLFWRCIQRYGNDHRLGCVETSDLRRSFEGESGRSLERFFYDWTERPGHPILEITTEERPREHEATVRVKQTQAGEPFHFPLRIVCRCEGSEEPVLVDRDITEKEQSYTVHLAGRLKTIEVDPAGSLLAEITEHKGGDLWLAELRQGGAGSRIRAAYHFGDARTSGGRQALIEALPQEKFWAVQAEIAQMLGEMVSGRDALVQGLHHSHPKTRRACARALGHFHNDEQAAAALKELLLAGDASYFVEAAALESYGQMRMADAVAVLTPWLNQPSHNDVLRTAALTGMAECSDVKAFPILLDWTKRGKPRTCRMTALGALAKLTGTADLSESQRREAARAIALCLDNETLLVRRAATNALREMGRAAMPEQAALQALARHDPDEQLRFQAARAAEAIESQSPLKSEITRLHEEIDRLRQSQEDLRQRLSRFEKPEARN
jgi:aminopeptidase N